MALAVLDITYGSDRHGLIWAYRFEPDRPPSELGSDAAAAWLAEPGNPGFLWLHFSQSNAASERWLRQTLSLPDAFYESLHEGVGSTRLELAGESLVAVIHDVLFDSAFDSSNVSSVSLCVTSRLIVSMRLRPLRSVDRLRAAVKNGLTFRSSAELLAHLLRDQADVLVDIVRRSTVRVNEVEDHLLANRISTDRSQLSALRRSLVRLQRLLAPEPAALFRLLSRPSTWVAERDMQELRSAAEELSTAVVDSVALAERVRLLQEELGSRVTEQTNRTLFILTVVTVLALPINLVAGLFGMNVGGVPLSQHPHGFIWVAGIAVALTVGLAYLALGRARDRPRR